MSLIYNGVNIGTVIYNGVTLDKIIYNGVTVYESIDYDSIYIFMDNKTSSDRATYLQIRSNASSGEIYYNEVGKTETLAGTITKSGSIRQGFNVPANKSVVIRLKGGQFTAYSDDLDHLISSDTSLPTKIILGNNFTGDMEHSIRNMPNLKEVWLTGNIRRININDCPLLTNLTMNEGPTGLTTLDGIGVSTITVPSTVTSIQNRAFENNTNLTTAYILGIKCYLNLSLFKGCNNLTNLYIYNTLSSWKNASEPSYSQVYNTNSNLTMHLPQSIGTIEQARTLYGNYFNYIDDTTLCTVLFDL